MGVTHDRNGATGRANHYVLQATAVTVHWGYFSRSLEPVLSVGSGDFVTIETLTHHAYDDHTRMIEGDPEPKASFSGRRTSRMSTGAAPGRLMHRSMGAVPARALACISAPAPSLCMTPNRVTCSRYGLSM